MPKRKGYHKARGGCSTCKQRKVRCSLERPVCQNCSILSRLCIYPNPAPENAKQSTFDRSALPPTAFQEVELMHHYTAYTCVTLTENPTLLSLWREAVPKHAFQHPFLLQGLLAIAAQHRLRHARNAINSTDLTRTADMYQQDALTSYIRLLSNITEDNCHALFAFSQVIVGIFYSRLSLDVYQETLEPLGIITSIINIFDLLRGARTIAEEASTWLLASDLKPMMGNMPEMPLRAVSSATFPSRAKALSMLSDHIKNYSNDHAKSRVQVGLLLSTIELLSTLDFDESKIEDRMNKIVGLPVAFDPHYLKLLKAHDQASLTILAYYGAALHQIRHVWCFEGVGAKIVHAVTGLVDHDWSTQLVWPQKEIRGENLWS